MHVEWLSPRASRPRSAVLGVITGGPGHIAKFFAEMNLPWCDRDEKETVLRRMQNECRGALSILVSARIIGGSRCNPSLSRCLLVVPDIFAGVGIQRDNGSEIEIIGRRGAARVPRSRATVAGPT